MVSPFLLSNIVTFLKGQNVMNGKGTRIDWSNDVKTENLDFRYPEFSDTILRFQYDYDANVGRIWNLFCLSQESLAGILLSVWKK